MSVGLLVFPLVIVGMMLASTTRRPAIPRTRRWLSTTARGVIVRTHARRAHGMKNGV